MTLEDLAVSILGIALVVFGFGIRYWVGRRRFYRRGLAGLQQYSSYSKSLIVSIFERFANFLSVPMILIGLLMLVFWWMYVRDVVLSAKKDRSATKTENKADPTSHFLVPAEKGFGETKISPIPKSSFPASMKTFG